MFTKLSAPNSKMTILRSKSLIRCYATQVKKFGDIPGPVSLPVIGTLHNYMPVIGSYSFDRLHHNGFKKLEKYGPIVREEMVPGVNVLWLFDPNDIETMFRYEGKYPCRRSHLALQKYRLDRPNVYNTGGLLPTNGETWYRLRKVFQKGLSSPTAVHNYLPASDEVVQEWFDRIEKIKGRAEHDFMPELSRLFLERTATLDLRLNSFSDDELRKRSRSSRLIRAALGTNSCILKTDNGPQLWRHFDTPIYKKLKTSQQYMEEVAIDLLSYKMSLFQENHKIGQELSLLESYQASPELDFKDIIGIVCDFLLAGIDTATYSASFLLYYVAKHPGVQKKLYAESRALLKYTDSPITVDLLSKAHYAKAVLKETMRLRPISVGIGRVLETDAVFSNYQVPKGTILVSQNQISCRLEKYFTNPDEFRPERWLKGDASYKAPHPFLLLPFGHGPRSCIARRLAEQNLHILMLKLVRNYEISWNGSELDTRSLLINRPDGPILLGLKRRNELKF